MKEGEVRRRNRIFCLSIFFSAVYLFWRLFCTLPWGEGIFQVLAGLLLLLAETVTAFGTAELMVGRMKSEGASLSLPQVPPEAFPEVDVLIATHNEPTGLLYKTVNACTFLECPDPGKVHIYVCDDGGRSLISRSPRCGWGWCRRRRVSIIRICSSLISMRKRGSLMSRISSPGRSIFLEMQPIRPPTREATR